MKEGETRMVAVTNEKGGVGKTVTVINLGAALAKAKERILIVDMDPQANATRGLGMDPRESRPGTYDMIKNDAPVSAEEVIRRTSWQGLDVMPSHVDLSGAEVELVDQPGRENRLGDALSAVGDRYDRILIDTPPSLSLLTVNVLACAGEVLIPCQTHPYAFDALEELFDTVSAVREAINPGLKTAGILATMVDQRTRVSRRVLEKLSSDARYKTHLFTTVIRMNTTIADSADVGKPVVYFRPKSYGALDYQNFAEEYRRRSVLIGKQ